MKKRLSWSLLAVAAAVLLWGRLASRPEALLTDARGVPMFLGGSGASLRLVRSGFIDTSLPRGPKRRRLPKTELLPEFRDSLSGLPSHESSSSSSLWSPASQEVVSARRNRDGSVSTAKRAPDFRRPKGAGPGGARARPGVAVAVRPAGPERSRDRLHSAVPKPGAGVRPVAVAVRPAPVERSSGRTPPRPASHDFDGRRLTKPSASISVPGWSPSSSSEKKPKPPRPEKPPVLSDWLGKGALKPPAGRLEPPTFAPLKKLFPERLPDGRAYERGTPPPSFIEGLRLPEDRPGYEDWLQKDRRRGRKAEAHWHQDGKEWVFHAGKAWGLTEGGRWAWALEADRRWWTVGDGAQRLVRHGAAWWWRTKDGWFLLKGGEPWAWRHFPAWEGHGFIHPGRGTQVVYSADGARVAVFTPGQDTVVFDALTGALLARFPPER